MAAKKASSALSSRAASEAASSAQVDTVVSTVDAVAEARLLATVFAYPQVLDDLPYLRESDFGVPSHSAIWSAVQAVDAASRPIDSITVCDELSRRGDLSRIGGPAGVELVLSAAPVPTELAAYQEIIKDRALRRRLAAAGSQIALSARSGAGDAGELASAAQEEIFAATSFSASEDSTVTMPELVAAVHSRMAVATTGALLGYSSGFAALDDVTCGYGPGQLIIVGARPGVGKSVMLLQMAKSIAAESDCIVPFFSYEMNHEEIGFRLLSAASGVPLSDLLRGRVPAGSERALSHAAEKLAALRLVIDDNPPPTIAGLRASVRRLARRSKVGAVVVDYLQLVRADGRRIENRVQEVSEISRELKMMAKEVAAPVLAASQLNRQLESRTGAARRPQLSDLRESGSVEQDANLVLFLHREGLNNPDISDDSAELIVGKNRQGPAGLSIPLSWRGATVSFAPLATTIVGRPPEELY